MNGQVLGAWKYFRNAEGNYSVYPARCDEDRRFPKTVLAEVFSEHAENPEFNARLIAASPEMKIALIGAVEALRATEVFMRERNFETKHLNDIVGIIDDLLDRIDGSSKK